MMIIVSACLAGVECRYNGEAFAIPEVVELVKRGQAIPVCPEVLGNLPIPRIRAEKRNERVFSEDGHNLTDQFLKGAQIAVNIAKEAGCKKAILKSKSPSCGCGWIYDGSFSGKLIKGDGIFCSLVKKEKIAVYTEDEIITDSTLL